MKTSALYFHITEEKLRTGRTKKKENNVSSWIQASFEENNASFISSKVFKKETSHAVTIVYYKATEYI